MVSPKGEEASLSKARDYCLGRARGEPSSSKMLNWRLKSQLSRQGRKRKKSRQQINPSREGGTFVASPLDDSPLFLPSQPFFLLWHLRRQQCTTRKDRKERREGGGCTNSFWLFSPLSSKMSPWQSTEKRTKGRRDGLNDGLIGCLSRTKRRTAPISRALPASPSFCLFSGREMIIFFRTGPLSYSLPAASPPPSSLLACLSVHFHILLSLPPFPFGVGLDSRREASRPPCPPPSSVPLF